MVQLMPLHPQTPSSLASSKSRLVLPFWYRLTQVVLEKRPLNGCTVVVIVVSIYFVLLYFVDLQSSDDNSDLDEDVW